jgi:glycosyltransferase involved in cell wall biosynthesis
MYPISLSVFFPCYNEEKNVEPLVNEALQALTGLVQQYEILIINDGSSDNTGSIANTLQQKHDTVRVIHHETNKGYGAALISGFRNARYEQVFFTDGDNQFYMSEIELLLKETGEADGVLGFRKNRKDPWHRIWYSRLWNRLVRIMFDLRVKDLNCAYKIIKKQYLDKIILHSSGAMITAELLIRLKIAGARFKEVGVTHRPRAFGTQTGGNPKVIVRAFRELLKLRQELKTAKLI